MGVFCERSLENCVDKPYVFSGDVSVVRIKQTGDVTIEVIDGEAFFHNPEVNLALYPDDPWVKNFGGDPFYKTVFGPSFAHTGVVSSRSANGQRLAIRRILGAMSGSVDGQNAYRERQKNFIAKHLIEGCFDALRAEILSELANFTTTLEECMKHYDDPHKKRDLRVNGFKELIGTGEYYEDLWFGKPGNQKYLIYKMKPAEYARLNKYPRAIGDFGVHASLQGFVFAALVKKAFVNVVTSHHGMTYHFCGGPSPAELTEVFERMFAPQQRGDFTCFSDDAVFAYNDDVRVRWNNLDISECDRSHSDSLFELFNWITDHHPTARELTNQCLAEFRVFNVVNGKIDRRNYVQYKGKKHILFSGSTITTVINNLANFLNYLAIAECIHGRANVTSVDIIGACAEAGYIVTLTECHQFEDLQFLKHSPTLDDEGIWRPVLNPGVFFRSAGRCSWDLPGRGPLKARAAAFFAAHLNGTYPYVRTPFLEALREKYPVTLSNKAVHDKLIRDDYRFQEAAARPSATHMWTFSHENFFRRYRLDGLQLATLLADASHARFGWSYTSSVYDVVLQIDYSLDPIGGCH